MMDRPKVSDAEVASGKRFVGTLRGHGSFELVQHSLIANVWNILEDRCPAVAVRICYGIVHAKRSVLAAIFTRQFTAPLFSGQPLFIELAEILVDATTRSDTLDSADLRKSFPADSVGACRTSG